MLAILALPISATIAEYVGGISAFHRQPSVGDRYTKPGPVVWISVPSMSWREIILEAGS